MNMVDKNYFNEFTKNKNKPVNILFVCSGNVCRSVYAEFEFRKMVEESKILRNKVIVESGAVQYKNLHIHQNTKKILIREGFDEEEINKFKPRYLKDQENENLMKNADIIIGMARGHKLFTPKEYRKKFKQISELAINEKKDVGDPYFADTFEEYDEMIKEVHDYLVILKEKLEKFYSK